MVLPVGWPPRAATNRRSIRFFVTGTATAAFADSAYLFSDQASANTFVPLPYVAPGQVANVKLGDLAAGGSPMGTGQDVHDANLLAPAGEQEVPHPMIWANTIRIFNDDGGGGALEISFDGVNVQGKIYKADGPIYYRNRFESGISVRGAGVVFRIEAW